MLSERATILSLFFKREREAMLLHGECSGVTLSHYRSVLSGGGVLITSTGLQIKAIDYAV
jgi:hypothetical protein